ncbi:peptidyl-prolyl cis-trans isomerase D [Escherichia coli]|uniref:Peptidyl-prolyl cis-trans isomerase D n=1 Tax=Escherichia coli TaxID=562 RepID=A0A2X3JPU9_ECOLX|nr:peptidyl-prolyl cis-trans isomerase D [Escherichia coli]
MLTRWRRSSLVTEQEIASYYEQNKNNFMTPEQFRVSYIKLDAATMQQPVSDADIQSYYDQHQDQFTQAQAYPLQHHPDQN